MITALELAYLAALEDLSARASKDASEFRARLRDQCDHPDERVYVIEREQSNGFGRWSPHKFKKCNICQAENHLTPLDFQEWNFCWKFWTKGLSQCCKSSVTLCNTRLWCTECGHVVTIQTLVLPSS